ncbi:MAG TPA: hypothetical protein DF613_15385 [Lachnospiraceae bacterium]|nr:hypothetical protein [Lachnospiraceae bacterium]
MLYIFLQNERNIAKTIRIMYIHRNTFLYRIRRIQQILGMDLELPRIRLLLWNALQILYGDEPDC